MTALADQGSDINLLPPHVLMKILKKESRSVVEPFDRTYYYNTVDNFALSLPCSRKAVANITVRVCHAANLVLRGMQWMGSSRPATCVIIGRDFLQVLRLDNRKLLAAACEHLREIVNVAEVLRTTNDASPSLMNETIQSLLSDS